MGLGQGFNRVTKKLGISSGIGSKELELLNNTLAQMPRRLKPDQLDMAPKGMPYVQINDTYYPKSRIENIHYISSVPDLDYKPLSPAVEWMQMGEIPTEVAFMTGKVDDDGDILYGFGRPADKSAALITNKDIRAEAKNWAKYAHSRNGAALYENHPIGGATGSRAKFYRRMGFVDGSDPSQNVQYLDARRSYGVPDTTNQIYEYGDHLVDAERGDYNLTNTLYPNKRHFKTHQNHFVTPESHPYETAIGQVPYQAIDLGGFY